MGTSDGLTKKTGIYWIFVGYAALIAGLFIVVLVINLAANIHDKWVFLHMTNAQHPWEAKKSSPDHVDVDLALRHLSAIPSDAPEAPEAQALATALRQKASEMEATDTRERAQAVATQVQKEAETKAANDNRAEAVLELGVGPKNLGYDLSVTMNPDRPEEIVVTSSEFSDTDHRVRFLSFMRGRNSPASGVCVNGFSKIRLKASQIPLLGFDDSYSLDCFSR